MNTACNRPYNQLSDWLKERFGQKVFKITVNAGLTCPNRDGTKGTGGCVYCAEGALLPKDSPASSSVIEQITAGRERIRKRHKAENFIAYFQLGSSTHAPVKRLKNILSGALCFADVLCVAVSTRPDCLDEAVLDLLCEIRKKKPLWIELGLQSSSDATLTKVNRCHTAADFDDALMRAHKRGIDVCAHVILGLPGESKDDMLGTARFISSRPVWGIKFHQLQVLKGTPLEQMYNTGGVRALPLEEYADIVVECLELLPPDMVIHRLCGDSPERYLIAPKWGANKFMVMEKVLRLLSERKTFQGAKFTPASAGKKGD
ncbi:MAG: TIGR01212 family radical SAM protein [Deltaproteobacteria bacterium]|nr:TIGR01212 family radical SAM protein [Deltaproteobacteria bacterium]